MHQQSSLGPGWTGLLVLLFLSLPLAGQSQPALKKRDQRKLTEVRAAMDLQRFAEAETQLADLLRKYPKVADLRYLQAGIASAQYDLPGAIAATQEGISLEEVPPPHALRSLGDFQLSNEEFGAAVASYRAYEQELQRLGRTHALSAAASLLRRAMVADSIAANPYPFSPEPLSAAINTRDLEYFPSLSPDGKELIFTRRVGRRQEDFYRSVRSDTGGWSRAEPLRGINTSMNEGAQTITADGNYLVFTGCGRKDGAGSCDLYASRRVDGVWSKARNLGRSINTAASESQPSLSRDGRLLFFTSNRAGGQGKDDLYVSGRSPAGGWAKPVNLGPTVNTGGNDRYPFWAADNRTLYFTSDSLPGMGQADLYKVTLDDNRWREVVNLGYPINTPGQETNLHITLDGRTAYFSKGVKGDIDIYTFELPRALRPDPATYLSIRVVDDSTSQPLAANVRLHPLVEASRTSVYSTGEDGRFLGVLPSGTDYGLSVEKEGYLFYSDRFELSGDFTRIDPFELTVRLRRPVLEIDTAIVLENVFFETASDSLLPVSTEELDRLAALLESSPELKVEIAGHTDSVGAPDDNQSLSERRARSVRQYLIQTGIREERVTAVGFGELRPVADNDSESGRARNRRTTFRLLR